MTSDSSSQVEMTGPTFDLVVVGSGAAGLMSALVAARDGASVHVLERSPLIGGTTAISGGQIWTPGNAHMEGIGRSDDRISALAYLRQVTLESVDECYLDAFLSHAAEAMALIESATPLRLFAVDRPDYHAEWSGARDGRSLEPLPLVHKAPVGYPPIRRSRYRRPVTSVEARQDNAAALADQRERDGVLTQGASLVAGLVEGCAAAGVTVSANVRLVDLVLVNGQVAGVVVIDEKGGEQRTIRAKAVVLASGGFEWNNALSKAFFGVVPQLPVSPPWNEGDGLLAGMRAGAQITNMGESWWTAAVAVPEEVEDGKPAARNIVRELALPGSLMVNRAGRRFVNEASSYNDLGKAFLQFDPRTCEYPNQRAWLVFDSTFKGRYNVVTTSSTASPPSWFRQADALAKLAAVMDVPVGEFETTISVFNERARNGNDDDFGRGHSRHDQFYGDSAHEPNACLAPLVTPPFFAIPIWLGNLGTKGGLVATVKGEVLRNGDGPIPGLFACGNVAASWMGLGYPGAGGSLGPILTAALLCGRAAAQFVGNNDLNPV